MADYKKVIEMLGDNLASFLEISKKLLIDWAIEPKKLLHLLHNLSKNDLIGLLNGTHEIVFKPILKLFDDSHEKFIIYKQQRHTTWREMLNSLVEEKDYDKLCVLKIGKDKDIEKEIEDFSYKNKELFIVFETYLLLAKSGNDFHVLLVRFHLDHKAIEVSRVNLTTSIYHASTQHQSYVMISRGHTHK